MGVRRPTVHLTGDSRSSVCEPRVDQQPVLVQQGCVVLPGRKRRQVVLAHDDAERLVRMGLAEVLHGASGVVGARQVELHARRSQLRMVGQCEVHHLQAMRLRNQVGPLFVGAGRGQHKPNFVQVRMLKHVVGDDQVPQMHRVERPEVQANALGT